MLAPFNETVSQDLQKVTTGGLIFEEKHWTLIMFCQIIIVPQFQHFTLKCCYLTRSSIVPNMKYLATFWDIEGNVTVIKSYTREKFEIKVPIYALKLQLTDLRTFRDPPHSIPLPSLASYISECFVIHIPRYGLELGPDNPQAVTLTTRLPFLDT